MIWQRTGGNPEALKGVDCRVDSPGCCLWKGDHAHMQTQNRQGERHRRKTVGSGNIAHFGIDPIPSNYRTSIADTDTDNFYLKIPDH